ncbi:hypothetical protein SDC9_73890 [bioreactor metagenome]|uniref:NAD-specific glutamate dehydrogenase n=1 Tax=bioreactor metagenome TaxID=1076179 RepID=A0A644YG06_9ZZZZ
MRIVADVGQHHLTGEDRHRLLLAADGALDLDDGVRRQDRRDELVDLVEALHLDGAAEVLDVDQRPQVAALVLLAHHLGDHPGDGDLLAVLGAVLVEDLLDATVGEPGQHRFHALQRVVGDVEAEHLALEGELGPLVPLLHVGHHDGGRVVLDGLVPEHREQVVLAVRLVALATGDLVDRLLEALHQGAPVVAHRVEGAGLDQRFDQPLVADGQRLLVEELVERPRPAALLAGGDDLLDDVLADVADGGQPEADVLPDRGELGRGLVDVGGQHLDAHPSALAEVDRHLVLVVLDRLQQPGHVLHRVVGLEVGGPVRDQPVRRGVGLVEGVVGERQQDVPQRLHRLGGVAALQHAVLEGLELGVQFLLLLLAHRPPEHVGATQGVAGQLLGDGHHLLLVDDQAVRLAEDVRQRLGQLGVDRLHRLLAGLAPGVLVVRVGAHRAGSVERADGRDVVEAVRLHRAQQRPHRPAVQLEDAEGVTGLQQLEGLRVVQGELLQHDLLVPVEPDVLQRVGEDGEVAQAEEVHLDQAQRLARRVVELGDDLAVLLALHQRDDVHDRLGRHDHPAGVHAPLPLQPLQAHRGVDDLAHLRLGVVQRAELLALQVALVAVVEQLLQRDVLAHHRVGHRLGDLVAQRVRLAQHPAGVLDRLLGLDGAVRDDRADLVGAVLVGDVLDHVAAAPVVEVDVEVGHRDALGVEEALEDQAVLDRVQLGDVQGVRAHRAGAGATAGADLDALGLGPLDVVGHHQEVPREAHLLDDADLVVGPVADLGGDPVGVAVVQALVDLGDEPGLLGLPRRHLEVRHELADRVLEADLAALGDLQGVVARLGELAEQLAHLPG